MPSPASSGRAARMGGLVVPIPRESVAPGPVPTFSIVTSAYQSASTVGGAVASALAQTRPALEVIVCDDGSTDDIDGALAPYRGRIRILRKPNGGGASALNHAARAARGEFVAILDADDVYHPRRLQALGELAAARPDLDILTSDAYVEMDGRIVGRFNHATPFVVDDQRTGIFRSCFVGGWPAVRRNRVLAAGGWDESFRIAYDWDCWLRLILAGARVGLVDEPLMSYRVHDGALSSDRIASLLERVALLERARRHPSLTRAERRYLAASARWQRSRLLREIEERAARDGDARALGMTVARSRELIAHVRFAGPRAALRSRLRRKRAVSASSHASS
jgi:glycosyltransferase involved in cell wall biosynthesis